MPKKAPSRRAPASPSRSESQIASKTTSGTTSGAGSWNEVNQEYLVAEFARLREQLEAKSGSKPGGERRVSEALQAAQKRAKQSAQPPAITRLAEIFALSEFERDVLLLCAGVEMDSGLAAQCGEALGRQRPSVTFGLAMAALAAPHWSALTPSRPLRRYQLIDIELGHGLATAPLRIEERILHYLAGINLLDPRLEPLLEASEQPAWIAEEHKAVAAQATAALQRFSASNASAGTPENIAQHQPILHLCGDDPHGQQDAAASAAAQSGRRLFTLRSDDIPAGATEAGSNPVDQFLTLWAREAALLDGLLLVQCGTAGFTPAVRRLVERLPGCAVLSSHEPVQLNRALIRFDVNKPQPQEQKRLWQQTLGPAAKNLNGFLDNLSEQFRLSARTIHATGSTTNSADAAALWNACRALTRPRLEDLAQRITSSAGWDDLILPDPQKLILRQIASQVSCRMKVYETWGFSAKGRRGLGISALFSGESGTGKTLAAEVLASELGLDLYRIDLSAVVSKYIGETEKNLRQVFDGAEEGGVLLLFDEADALFGKRSDVKDSHDRYANIEVGYLLQRMEAYQGLAILTTNLKSAMDRAFQRRLRFTVNFPFPDIAQREAIWKLAFPQATPTSDLDAARLAQLKVAGGSIRNIALNAAFLAAEAKKPVEMAHVLEAARLEALKIERPLSEAEIKGWV